MDASFITQALEFAKQLTGFLGEFEASGILNIVQKFLANIDLSQISSLLSNILAIFGQLA
ncbi:MAG: hypothetical protein IJL77_00670 [Clostridia bacterium]|nr:hypothetical protein [Clostridia bacterium]